MPFQLRPLGERGRCFYGQLRLPDFFSRAFRRIGRKPTWMNLVSAFTRQNRTGCLQKNFDVEPEGPGASVLQVQTNHLVEPGPAATFDLPQARDSGLDFQHAAAMPKVVRFKFVRHRRTRPDQRHITDQHIPELRELIKTRPAKEPADGSDSRIFLNLEHRLFAVRRAARQLGRR